MLCVSLIVRCCELCCAFLRACVGMCVACGLLRDVQWFVFLLVCVFVRCLYKCGCVLFMMYCMLLCDLFCLFGICVRLCVKHVSTNVCAA